MSTSFIFSFFVFKRTIVRNLTAKATSYFLLSIYTGAFLIPYVIMVIFGSWPVFFLEIAIGQYTNLGSAKAFQIVPIMKGKTADILLPLI